MVTALTEDTIGTWFEVPSKYLNPNLTIKYKVWGGISIKFRVEKRGPGYVGIGVGGSTMADCDYVLIEKDSTNFSISLRDCVYNASNPTFPIDCSEEDQDWVFLAADSFQADANSMIVEFNRSMKAVSASDRSVVSNSVNKFIWAVGSSDTVKDSNSYHGPSDLNRGIFDVVLGSARSSYLFKVGYALIFLAYLTYDLI